MKTKKKIRKPEVEAWRAELKRIVRFLNKGDGGSRRLWDVLSALRGPDLEDSEEIKNCTTAVIRAAIGMKGEPILPAHIEADCAPLAERRIQLPLGGYHFKCHAERAFKALGLKWFEIN